MNLTNNNHYNKAYELIFQGNNNNKFVNFKIILNKSTNIS